MEKLTWNVIYHDYNRNEITTYNIFQHGSFVEDIRKHYKKCKTKEEFAKNLKSSLMYYFWSKCEWEILISPWCGSRRTEPIKVDVYWQVMNNWDLFLDYVWSHKARSRKTESN